ncbi:hypothetical protein FSP39_005618 [Pinctada imbricata]|uniref:Uncharacterized protein n=1 Tax=Pinctada imbricata TaxID=66713 RepID=A0AA88XVK0_PINIB|nr:hypothetical protein FSP39_005618 [Pinctada imbricata]
MLVGGSAFGVWKYIQFKKQGPKFDRAPSDLIDDSRDDTNGRDRKPFNKNRKVTPERERHDSDTETYARPYSNPLSLSGDSEYGFDDTPRGTPLGLSDIEQDSNQGRWGNSPASQSRPSQKVPTASSGGLNNWMF